MRTSRAAHSPELCVQCTHDCSQLVSVNRAILIAVKVLLVVAQQSIAHISDEQSVLLGHCGASL
jgi:hypothetical protein